MAEITVLTVTKRTGWFNAAAECMASQTEPFEWLIVYEHHCKPRIHNSPRLDSARWIPAPPRIRRSNLNASLNEGLRQVKTEYVVFYQDFIKLKPSVLRMLLAAAQVTGGFVTTATINPDGNYDHRYTGADTIRLCQPEEWEANVAIAPMEAIRQLGGFDESYDDGWSWDNVNLAERAAMLGYDFYIDERIKPQLLYHPKEPDLDPTLTLNGNYHLVRMDEIRTGKYPLKLPYL